VPESSASQPGGEAAQRAAAPSRSRADRPPIPERPQPAGFPKEALDYLHDARRIIQQADRRLREGEASNAFLGEIGMSREQVRRFIISWQRKLEATSAGAQVTAVPGARQEAMGGAQGEPLRPGRASAGGPVRDTEAAGRDAIDLVTEAETGTSGRLQSAVSAYFEAVGRAAGQGPAREDRKP
jgi:hypothetical protein